MKRLSPLILLIFPFIQACAQYGDSGGVSSQPIQTSVVSQPTAPVTYQPPATSSPQPGPLCSQDIICQMACKATFPVTTILAIERQYAVTGNNPLRAIAANELNIESLEECLNLSPTDASQFMSNPPTLGTVYIKVQYGSNYLCFDQGALVTCK